MADRFVVQVMFVSLSLVACGDDGGAPTGSETAGGSTQASTGDAATSTGTTADPTDTPTEPQSTGETGTTGEPPVDGLVPLVFVSRQINEQGSIYWDVPKDMAGVGAHSRVRPAAPGRLVVRESDGSERVLIDGAAPSPATLELIDVNAPTVAWDGATIAFAGLPAGDWSDLPAVSTGGWRLYMIDADGQNLRQITFSDEDDLDLSQHGDAAGGLGNYDDYDPAFLPDGRLVFASTRSRGHAHYSGVRLSNLYVVSADGGDLHRITSERNGADRPLIDPVTGMIVYARWWRNHRFPIDSMETILEQDPTKGYLQHTGLTSDRNQHVGAPDMFRNAWQAATIAPDGTRLAMWTGIGRAEAANHVYGGAFTPDGFLYTNYFPMYNMTEAAGFGGIRLYARGPSGYLDILGVSTSTLDYVHKEDPISYGIETPPYASEPEVLPDGRLVISYATGVDQDYGLYLIEGDGSGLTKLHDLPGTAELRARVLAPRPVPPVVDDILKDDPGSFADPLPPDADGPYDGGGTFTFRALNVYFNAPVDTGIVSAIPVGSAGTIRFYIDHQRDSPGSFPGLDWPVLLGELPVAPDGSVEDPNAPAYVPLFEQIRSPMPGYRVPETGGVYPNGAAHVAGMNFGTPGQIARCVGCHAGHTMIAVPEDDADAQFTNLAPGATVEVSSARDPDYQTGVIDRLALFGEIWRAWTSEPDQQHGQWVRLTFAVPVTVRTVRLYNLRPGDEANSDVQVHAATVRLFSDAGGLMEVASAGADELAAEGTDVAFADVVARSVRVDLDDVSGTFYGAACAGLAEIEVIARGEAD